MPRVAPKLPHDISKSRFCAGLQCLRRLWWEVHEPDAPELRPDDRQQVVLDRGHRVGELARERFANGTLIEIDPWKFGERIEATAAALRAGANVVFEASFAGGGVFAALDVLERLERGWALVEEGREKLRKQLLAYCGRDTLALVRLTKRLSEIAR